MGSKQLARTRAITALLEEPTIGKAATAAGISERTLRRWLATTDFSEQLSDAQRELTDRSLLRLSIASAKAIETLEKLLRSKATVAVRAASVLLSQSLKILETRDVLERLAAVERRLEAAKNGENGHHVRRLTLKMDSNWANTKYHDHGIDKTFG